MLSRLLNPANHELRRTHEETVSSHTESQSRYKTTHKSARFYFLRFERQTKLALVTRQPARLSIKKKYSLRAQDEAQKEARKYLAHDLTRSKFDALNIRLRCSQSCSIVVRSHRRRVRGTSINLISQSIPYSRCEHEKCYQMTREDQLAKKSSVVRYEDLDPCKDVHGRTANMTNSSRPSKRYMP